MMKEQVIAIFDIGKTNKKLLLFNIDLKLVSEAEEKFGQIKDEYGFECDNIELIEEWIRDSIRKLVHSDLYELKAVNFTTYGATLVYLDANGKRLTPVYNYLKPVNDDIPEKLYGKYGGKNEFSRCTASPALGMLNSGIQALWLKTERPHVFSRIKYILHFPQYISFLLTGKVYSEHTSIGCHTALWDFDNMKYHRWVVDEGLEVPDPSPVETIEEVLFEGNRIKVGIGIHDSSASLAPYFGLSSNKFLLVSTGTWCINMNPFNNERLTSVQLEHDCLCYMSITRQPVKSSRLFLGNLHEKGVRMLSAYFKIHQESFKLIKPDSRLLKKFGEKFGNRKVFFNDEEQSTEFKEEIDFFIFDNFIEGYHQLMIELCDLVIASINLVLTEEDDTDDIYLTGGFSKNELFVKLIASSFPLKKVYASEVSNATALGAAWVILNSLETEKKPALNMELKEIII
jgi:sugar (pentulose or hexulose) kinase